MGSNLNAITGTEGEIRAVQDDLDRLMGYPSKGVNVGAGPHVSIPDTYSPGALGWTAHHTGVRKHPAKDEFAIELDTKVSAALADPDRRKVLTAAKAAALDAAVATAAKLPADWQPADPIAAVEVPRHA